MEINREKFRVAAMLIALANGGCVARQSQINFHEVQTPWSGSAPQPVHNQPPAAEGYPPPQYGGPSYEYPQGTQYAPPAEEWYPPQQEYAPPQQEGAPYLE